MMRRTLFILVVLLVLSVFGMTIFARAGDDLPPIPLTTRTARLAGDANADGTVDLRDVVVITRHLAGGWYVTILAENADVNADNEINLKDA